MAESNHCVYKHAIGGETVGILAEILELAEKAESGKEGATPEKVFAIAVRNEEKQQQCKDSRKDGEKVFRR